MRNHLPLDEFTARACTILPTETSAQPCPCCGHPLTTAKGILRLLSEPTGFYQGSFAPIHKRRIATLIILIDTGSPHLFYYNLRVEQGHVLWGFRDARELRPQFALRGFPANLRFHSSLESAKQDADIYRLFYCYNHVIAYTDPHIATYLQGNHADDPTESGA